MKCPLSRLSLTCLAGCLFCRDQLLFLMQQGAAMGGANYRGDCGGSSAAESADMMA
jgi:hypothetical protein